MGNDFWTWTNISIAAIVAAILLFIGFWVVKKRRAPRSSLLDADAAVQDGEQFGYVRPVRSYSENVERFTAAWRSIDNRDK
ncbi:hypothetical protein [Devosia chinhatensis]|uniref:Uncharacterized protein n=1 Tax=Devosia chinhatensis TaxID=429727 RepID=A0A0F5FK34_9HYPH|nr:hypothetical protein [Devosia chinhatensis]KKB09254.1 hypothetical protein VE26_04540 [Devosia chinhatensis]